MSSGKKLLENSILYSFSGILTKCINFILLPIYTASLTSTDYGIYSLVGSFVGAALYLVCLGLENTVIRFYCDYREDKEKLSRFIGSCLYPVFFMDLVLILVCVIFREALCRYVLEGVSFFPFVVIGLLELSCLSLNTIYHGVLRAQGSGRKMTATSLGMFLISTVMTLLLVVGLKKGAAGMLLAITISRAALSAYAVYDLKKRELLSFSLEFSWLKKSLSYSLPLVPYQISTNIASFVSRVFLNGATALSTVGVYNISTQIAMVVDTVQDSVGYAFRPWLNETLNEGAPEGKRRIQNLSEMMMSFFSIIFIGIGLFSYEAVHLFFGESYWGAWKIVPILTAACSIKAIEYFYTYQCLYFPQTAKKIFIVSLTGNFANIILAAILAKPLGMVGAALAQLLANTIMAVGAVILAGTQGKIGYRLSSLVLPLFCSWGVIALGVLPPMIFSFGGFHWLFFVGKLLLTGVYAMLVLFRYQAEFLGLFRSYLQKKKHSV